MDDPWKTARRRLALLYREGRLVPFVGAGMSAPILPTWRGLLEQLADIAGTEGPGDDGDSHTLVRDAQRIARVLRGLGPEELANAIRTAFADGEESEATPQTRALTELWWPLIVTTNYDGMLSRTIADRWGTTLVVGRSDLSCFEVSSTLAGTTPPTIWAIQGFVGEVAPTVSVAEGTPDEIVLGHAQYREVTYKQPGFRRTFSEVCRSRSLLFLGSSLESYLLELLSEVRELHGANHLWHYAFVSKDDAFDPEWFEREYQIRVLQYDDHSRLPVWLGELRAEANGIYRQKSWHFATGSARSEVDVCEGALPVDFGEDECVVVSAGGRGGAPESSRHRLAFSEGIQGYLAELGVDPADADAWEAPGGDDYVFRSRQNSSVYAARARDDDDVRTLESVWSATKIALEQTTSCTRRHMQLLASGEGLDRERTFAPRHAFAMMLRAIGGLEQSASVRLHILDPQITAELRRGRLSVETHLSSLDIRYGVTVAYGDGHVQRHIEIEPNDSGRTIGKLAKKLGVPDDWRVRIWPTWLPKPVMELSDIADQRLVKIVVPDCMVHFMAP